MSDANTGLSVVDSQRLRARVHGTRVPAAVVADLEAVGAAVERVNALWTQAQADAETLREQGRREGYEAGRREAQEQLARVLAGAHERASEFAQRSESRVVAVAIEAIRKIVPHLAREDVVAELAKDAVRNASSLENTVVHVHRDAEERVSHSLREWAEGHGMTQVPRVTGDPTLAAEDVVVTSPLGTLRAGLNERLGVIENVLRSTAESLDARGA